jgi:hypothetical protein
MAANELQFVHYLAFANGSVNVIWTFRWKASFGLFWSLVLLSFGVSQDCPCLESVHNLFCFTDGIPFGTFSFTVCTFGRLFPAAGFDVKYIGYHVLATLMLPFGSVITALSS